MNINQLSELKPIFSNRQSFYGKAMVSPDGKVLYSYLTPVAMINKGKLTITEDADSLTATTMTHIHEFLKQNGIPDLPKQALIKKYSGKIAGQGLTVTVRFSH